MTEENSLTAIVRIMSPLEQNINVFFKQALQLDSFTLKLEAQENAS